MYSFNKTNTNTNTIVYLLMHTDPGNDVDDEVSFGYTVRHLLKCLNCSAYMVVSVKTKNVARLLEIGMKPFTGIDISPEFNFENKIPLSNGNTLTILFHDGTTFVPDTYYPNYILSISPGLDNVIKECNLVNLRGFSHQGLADTTRRPDNWNGFNDNCSKTMIECMMNLGVCYKVTTPFESFNTLFGKDTFKFYGIPEEIHNQIEQDAFKMIIGRMPPTVPAFILHMAETLVNILLAEELGKPGTNSRLVLGIRSKFTGTVQEISSDLREWIKRACVVYVDNLIEAAASAGSTTSPIKQYDQTVASLFELTIALAEMGMPYLDESGIRLIYSSDGNIAEKYPEAFDQFKKIGVFTPAYDLITAVKLIDLLEKDNFFN